MEKEIFVKPIMSLDKFFKVADFLQNSKDDELEKLGYAMTDAYRNSLIEKEEKKPTPSSSDMGTQNPAECKSGVCD